MRRMRFKTLYLALLCNIACIPAGSAGSEQNCAPGDLICNPFEALITYDFPDSSSGASLPKIIFLSTTTTDGFFGGVAAADGICASDAASLGYAGTFKAFLNSVQGSSRIASLTADTGDGQVDWVLAANTNYYRADGTTLIGTTTSGAIFDTLSGLTNSITGSGDNYWTGFLSDWTSGSDTSDLCDFSSVTSWSNSGGAFGRYGNGSFTTSGAIAQATQNCSTVIHLLCVRQ